ncbi:MAG TPA: YDG domain-containing protein [Caldimonas sp.]|jgi:filamentous hemagglutinin family protein|nr:YDG domain-containing protein [Caldimonas sp.]HEX2542404.1 YDG domain-containing protein [Caldimonas sp.]
MNKHLHRLVFSRSRGFCVAVAETSTVAGKAASGERSARRGASLVAAGLLALGLLAAVDASAQATPAAGAPSVLPGGGRIVSGTGSIATSGAAMTVQQSTPRLIADWQSFSIGAGNAVRFVQPSAGAVALNRVTGNQASEIFGSLTANGHVYLQNANGVLFAPGSQVSVGSLVATSLAVDPAHFMQGTLRMAGGSRASGPVANEGSLVAAPGGHVVLAAPRVSNAGTISTPGGTTALVAGNAVDVDPTGSGLLTISVPVASIEASLRQSGIVNADGGAVQLAAAASDAALRTVMQVGGVVRARSIEQRGGQILLSGGSSGVVAVDGVLDASAPTSSGGTIKVLGERVALTGAARLDASGASGGGTVLVGGNWQGQGLEANARDAYVAAGAVLDASATERGDGGQVVVWSDGRTNYFGQASARGGGQGGDGGRIEVSGQGSLRFEGGADLRAPRGRVGSLLLDPTFLIVGNTADVNGDGNTGDDLAANVFAGDPGGTSQVTATRVASLLATTNVTLQSTQTLSVNAPVTVAAGGAASTLALQSPQIAVTAPMTLNNASLTATAAQSVVLGASVQSNASVSLASPSITVNAPLSAPDVVLTASGTMSQSAAGAITATNLSLRRPGAASGAATVTFGAADNQVANLSMDINDGTFRVVNPAGVPLSLSGSADAVTLLAVNTAVTQPLVPGGALTLGVGEGAPFSLTTTGTGNVTLDNAANNFQSGMSFNVAGNLSIRETGSMSVNGGVATGDVVLRATGVFFLNGDIGGRNIDITSVGFNADDTLLLTPSGGRFFIRSSDFTLDNFNSPLFGTGPNDINYVSLGGYTGPDPTTGNGLYTNRTGTITPPNADNPPVAKVYDGTTGFAFTQAGPTATATLELVGPGPFAVNTYTIASSGNFADENAGVNKGHTVAATTNTRAVNPAQLVYLGLRFAGYTRAPGLHSPGAPGNPVSQITQRPVTGTGINGVDRVYDATTNLALDTSGAGLAGTIAGDLVTLVTSGATGTLFDKNAGVDKPYAIGGLSLAGPDAGNYLITGAIGEPPTITPRGIASTGLAGVNRVYDGTTVVAVNSAGGVLTGVLPGDVVGIAAAGLSGTVANKNVGVAKPVTVGTVTLAGPDAGNYVASDASGATATITPRPITSTGITGVDRVYDTTTTVAVSTAGATLGNTVAGDNVSLVGSAATGSIADKNVGVAKPVTVAGLALGGSDAVNYSLTDASSPTVNITPFVLQATGIRAIDRPVNGGTVVDLDTAGAGVAGVLPGDVVGVDASAAVGSVATPDPGLAKLVTVTGIALTGPDAINYSIAPTPIGPTGGGLTVRILSASSALFEELRFKEYLQAVSDAQEPFRRAMAEALASGFGKENIRRQLQRGLVFETGLAPPAIEIIESAGKPATCTPTAGAVLVCAR